MGMYVAVRGWLEFDHEQRPEIERVLAESEHDCSGGWMLPPRPFNWTLYLSYGGDVREQAVGSLRAQVAALAALEPVDDDQDWPAGFLMLGDERQQSVSWTVRDGQVIEEPAPPELRWFAARP
ncbi:hypothetical protein LFM09_09020 [Lentzea alba]|uniref:hypothetical protein n=1 Tax=Lentzea alba TaxID=2714351 RepID=UPI0039BF119E